MEALDAHHERVSVAVYSFLGLPPHVDPAPQHTRPKKAKGAAAAAERARQPLPPEVAAALGKMFGNHRNYLSLLLRSPLGRNVTVMAQRNFVELDEQQPSGPAASGAVGETLLIRTPHAAVAAADSGA